MSFDEQPSESQTRHADALQSGPGALAAFFANERVVEILLNADGVVWVDTIGEGVLSDDGAHGALHAERMLRLVASEMRVELNAQHPSLSAKLPPPWSARLQGAIALEPGEKILGQPASGDVVR